MAGVHADEITVDSDLVSRLVRSQFPQWNALPVAELGSSGTDNAVFRLGAGLLVRLPRRRSSVAALEKEQVCLPRFAGRLSLTIPEMMGIGTPTEKFPYPWSVVRWIDGAPLREDDVSDWIDLPRRLALFVRGLQEQDANGGPSPGKHNFWRGCPITAREAATRNALANLTGVVDEHRVLAAWQEDSAAPPWSKPPLWIHGDLHAQNMLSLRGRLHAVIDFGCLGVGDPACDLTAAWRMMSAAARAAFKEAVQPDDATWRRARAWALSISLLELDYYRNQPMPLIGIATRTVSEILEDHRTAGAADV